MNYWIYHYIDRYIGIPIIFFLKFFDKIFRMLKSKRCYKIKKILVIKLTMIGDTILLYPTIKALKEKYKDCEVTILCSKVNEKIIQQWDFIDKYIVFRFDYIFKKPWYIIFQLWSLSKSKFDLAVDFEQWFRITPIIAYLTAKLKFGFKTPKQYRHYLFDFAVAHIKNRHEVLCFCDLVEPLGVEVKEKKLFLKVDETIKEKFRKFLKEKEFVIVHAGCGIHGYYRQWEPKKYAEVIEYINSKGYKVVLTGSKDDIKVSKEIKKYTDKFLDLTSKTTLEELVALVSLSKFVLCGNTGVLHIAAALDIPTIAIHGPTNSLKWGPWSKGHIVIQSKLDCVPCSYLGFEYGCKTRRCLKEISVGEVKKAADKLLQ